MAEKITGKAPGGRKGKGGTVTQLPGTKRAGTGGDGRVLTSVDNLSPEEQAEAAAKQQKAREEAEAIQLMSVVSQVKAQDVKVEAAAAKLKVEKDALNGIFLNAKAASPLFTRQRIRELVDDSKPEVRRNIAENEAVRARFRRVMGLPVGLSEQERELEARLPQVERDGQFWRAAGYTAGLAGHDRDAPKECVAAGHDNLFDEGWKDGQGALGRAMTERANPKPTAQAAPKEETAAQRKKREKQEEADAKAALEGKGKEPALPTDAKAVGEQAAADFAADNPGLPPETISTPEPDHGHTAGDFTEATEEELAAQAGRPVAEEAETV